MFRLKTERPGFTEHNVAVAAQSDMFCRHQPIINTMMLVFTQHYRRIQTTYLIQKRPIGHHTAAQIQNIRTGRQGLIYLANITDADNDGLACFLQIRNFPNNRPNP